MILKRSLLLPPRYFFEEPGGKCLNILLEIFQDPCWLNPAAFAVLARWYPVRGVYSYLTRLWRWGLLCLVRKESSNIIQGAVLIREVRSGYSTRLIHSEG